MGNEQNSKFTKKVSPLIEGQVPEFVQADHPVFVDFLKDYFKFVEAGRLKISGDIDYIIQEFFMKQIQIKFVKWFLKELYY